MDAVRRAAAALREYAEQTATCTKCALAAGRTRVVFGSGSPNADLMFRGRGTRVPRGSAGVSRSSGKPASSSTACSRSIGLTRADVYVVNVLKCRPPGNRDPLPEGDRRCEPHLFRQIELMEPKLVATLRNFATKLLSGRPRRDHACARSATGGRSARGRSPSTALPRRRALHPVDVEGARGGLRRNPELLDEAQDSPPEVETPPVAEREPEPVQLGLF